MEKRTGFSSCSLGDRLLAALISIGMTLCITLTFAQSVQLPHNDARTDSIKVAKIVQQDARLKTVSDSMSAINRKWDEIERRIIEMKQQQPK